MGITAINQRVRLNARSAGEVKPAAPALKSEDTGQQRNAVSWGAHLSALGKTQIHFGAKISGTPENPELVKYLNSKFQTGNHPVQNYRAGDLIIHFLNNLNAYSSKRGVVQLHHNNREFSTGYTNYLQGPLGFRNPTERNRVIMEFLDKKLLSYKDKPAAEAKQETSGGAPPSENAGSDTPNSTSRELIPYVPPKIQAEPPYITRKALTVAIDWVLQKHQSVPERSGNGTLQYITPPMDLSKFGIEGILDSTLFNEEEKKIIRERQATASSGDSSNAAKAKAWLETVQSFPWLNQTIDRHDGEEAKKIFESRFYAMDDLKKRMVQEVTARKFTGANQGGIIILVGPPGTGKTASAEALAEVLGRKYAQISLAGSNDAHTLKGHHYTYVGSEAGEVVQAMIKAGTINPVIQIDEIDKVQQNAHGGNPLDALLAVLDPKENHRYKEEYLGRMPVDLSKVLFVCTANSLKDVHPALLNRATIIEFEPYVTEEKREIAIRHMIKAKQQKYHMKPGQVSFKKDAIEHIIQHYTDEGGVRRLDERLEEVFKSVCQVLKKPENRAQIVITKEYVDKWLTKPNYKKTVDVTKSRIGQINGLYYSSSGTGGGIIPVQTLVLDGGKGEFSLTGMPGEVMQQAAKVATSCIRSAHQEGLIKLDPKVIEKLQKREVDIHIHYPDGATPKDGPSAGTSTLVSLWSALTRTPIPEGIALTGEIDLFGNITAIGGIRGKVSNAIEQGVKVIYLPQENEKRFSELRAESPAFRKMVDSISIRFVSTASELLNDIQQESEKQQTPRLRIVESSPVVPLDTAALA